MVGFRMVVFISEVTQWLVLFISENPKWLVLYQSSRSGCFPIRVSSVDGFI